MHSAFSFSDSWYCCSWEKDFFKLSKSLLIGEENFNLLYLNKHRFPFGDKYQALLELNRTFLKPSNDFLRFCYYLLLEMRTILFNNLEFLWCFLQYLADDNLVIWTSHGSPRKPIAMGWCPLLCAVRLISSGVC